MLSFSARKEGDPKSGGQRGGLYCREGAGPGVCVCLCVCAGRPASAGRGRAARPCKLPLPAGVGRWGALIWGSSRENPRRRPRMSQDAESQRLCIASRGHTRVQCMHTHARACTGSLMQFPGCKTCRVARPGKGGRRGELRNASWDPSPALPALRGTMVGGEASTPPPPAGKRCHLPQPNAPRCRRQRNRSLRFSAAPPRGRQRALCLFSPRRSGRRLGGESVSSSAAASNAARRRAAPAGELLGERMGGGRRFP